ncbi:MAG: carboxylesterase family protein, partial [Duodenibacillus sp.]|nr:carboxylesterase family protein [Duodenibacillus sp.]
GSRFFGYANTQQSAERVGRHTASPIYAASFRWGENPEVVGEEMAFIHGSKHGIHMDFLFGEKKFDLQKKYPEAYKNAGVPALGSLLQRYIGNFVATGDPNGAGLAQWQPWDKSGKGASCLFLDADKERAWAEMGNCRIDPKATFAAMRADMTVSEEAKALLIGKVMDGRFFSAPLDAEFGNPAHIMP